MCGNREISIAACNFDISNKNYALISFHSLLVCSVTFSIAEVICIALKVDNQ